MGIITQDGGILCANCVAENIDLITNIDASAQWAPNVVYCVDADDGGIDGEKATICGNCRRPILDCTKD